MMGCRGYVYVCTTCMYNNRRIDFAVFSCICMLVVHAERQTGVLHSTSKLFIIFTPLYEYAICEQGLPHLLRH
jgi:hypothetical protein